ncbi:MAG: NADH-quinone oxidoreductase subunit A [Polyangiales bacterium]
MLGIWGIVEMAVFLGVLALTLVYAWKKGALEWEK